MDTQKKEKGSEIRPAHPVCCFDASLRRHPSLIVTRIVTETVTETVTQAVTQTVTSGRSVDGPPVSIPALLVAQDLVRLVEDLDDLVNDLAEIRGARREHAARRELPA